MKHFKIVSTGDLEITIHMTAQCEHWYRYDCIDDFRDHVWAQCGGGVSDELENILSGLDVWTLVTLRYTSPAGLLPMQEYTETTFELAGSKVR